MKPDDDARDTEQVDRHLAVLDTMDFDVFTNQRWDRLNDVLVEDVVSTFPDGRVENGIEEHQRTLAFQFSWAPDTAIAEHPIRFGQGDWAIVRGPMAGTFTKPMILADGTAIEPTGKRFEVALVTIAHFSADGKVDRQYLSYDNEALRSQLGIST